MPLVLRRNKTTPLTYIEMDGNFEYLENLTDTILSESDVRGLISVNDTGGDGSLSYNSSTGVLTYTGPTATEVRAHFTGGSGIAISNGIVSVDFSEFNTNSIVEGANNLYFTNSRADARIAAASIDDLVDVNTTGANTNQVLTWNGTIWVPATPPGAAGGEANTASNVGAGAEIFKQKAFFDLEFRSMIGSDPIEVIQNSNDITLSFFPNSDIDFNTHKIINLGNPTNLQDAATKSYVDSLIAAQNLNFSADVGSGSIDLDSQSLTIVGTANEITTTAFGQTLTLGLPNRILVDLQGDVYAMDNSSLLVDSSTGTFFGNLSGNSDTATTAETVTVAAQPNINSVGTLTGLTVNGGIDFNNNSITNIGEPTNPQDAATKSYVDTIAAATLHYHDPVRVEAETELSATYNNGTSGVGATLTNTGAQAALVIDGVALNIADRVLIRLQSNAAHNGVYVVTTVGDNSSNWVLTRSDDADNNGSISPNSLGEGDAFYVLEGSIGAGQLYVMNTMGAITFGTTDITFTQISSAQIYSAGAGLNLVGTTFIANVSLGLHTNGSYVESISNGSYLTGADGGAVGSTLTLGVDATSNNTANKVVARDSNGDFSANTITATLNGNASTATVWQTSRSLTLTGDVTGSISGVNGSGNISIATTIAANSVELGTDTTGNYVAAGITSGNGISGSVNSEGGTFTVTSNATSANTNSTIVFRDNSGNFSAGTITANLTGNATTATSATTVVVTENNIANETVYLTFVDGTTGSQDIEIDTNLTYNPSTNILSTTATQAQYADLAENYSADNQYEAGTIVKLGGDSEITQTVSANDLDVFGVISENPAYLMNSHSQGLPVALTGRVSVKVVGPVVKGQRIVSSNIPGVGIAVNNSEIMNVLTIVGRALESNTDQNTKLIECAIGKL
jgi:hypothetical protein